MYHHSKIYYKDKQKIKIQIASYTLQFVLLFLIFSLLNIYLFHLDWTPFIIIPLFYFIFLQRYLRQFRYYLRITDESICISNDLPTHSEEIFWDEIERIDYRNAKEITVKTLSGRAICVKKDVIDYTAAWVDIWQEAQKHANIVVDNSLTKALEIYTNNQQS